MTIEDWRAEIDLVDAELLRLLNARAALAIRVGETKRGAGLSVADGAREREVVERARRANAGPLDSAAVARLFRRIIQESRRAEAAALEESDAAPFAATDAQMKEALP
jgi:chorismate mutase